MISNTRIFKHAAAHIFFQHHVCNLQWFSIRHFSNMQPRIIVFNIRSVISNELQPILQQHTGCTYNTVHAVNTVQCIQYFGIQRNPRESMGVRKKSKESPGILGNHRESWEFLGVLRNPSESSESPGIHGNLWKPWGILGNTRETWEFSGISLDIQDFRGHSWNMDMK